MRPGGSTPEELETLFEDAFVVRDREALSGLFEDGAVLAARHTDGVARGSEAIARFATATWEREGTYVAVPYRILQARDTALVVARWGINVVRRGSDGSWRYAISLLDMPAANPEEER